MIKNRIFIFLACFLFSSQLFAQLPLYQFNPQGSVNTDILSDITSRLGSQERQNGYDSDPETRTHEYQHQINATIRNLNGGTGNVNAVYFGQGYSYILREPKCKLSDVAQNVPNEYRNYLYNLYLVQQRRWWENEPLYVLDELSAYYAGALYARQAGIKDHGSAEHAYYFVHYSYALILTIKERDPNYPDMVALESLFIFYRERIRELFNENMSQRDNPLFLLRIDPITKETGRYSQEIRNDIFRGGRNR